MKVEKEKHKLAIYIKDAAFPQTVEGEEAFFHTKGLTKREYFAAMAMQGILAQGKYNHSITQLAVDSVMMANTLVIALNNTDNPNLQP